MREGTHARTRILHERHLVSDLGEKADGSLHDVIDVDGLGQKRLKRVALGGAHRLELRETVNEDPVSAVGGHAPGGGVRLVDEACLFQHGHVVADGRGGDTQSPRNTSSLRLCALFLGISAPSTPGTPAS